MASKSQVLVLIVKLVCDNVWEQPGLLLLHNMVSLRLEQCGSIPARLQAAA